MSVACRLLASACALLAPAYTAHCADLRSAFTERERDIILSLSPLPAAPKDSTNGVDGDEAGVELGQKLFFDTRLSGTGAVACAT